MKFSVNAACCLVDSMNGIRYTEGITKQSHIYHNVRCAIAMDRLDEKWFLTTQDRDRLIGQLSKLSEEDADVLLDKIHRFWAASPHDDVRDAVCDFEIGDVYILDWSINTGKSSQRVDMSGVKQLVLKNETN